MPAFRPRMTAAALFALTLATYLPSLGNGYIWDDEQYVTDNDVLRSWEGLRRAWLTPGATKNYYPVTQTSFFVEYRLWGLRPVGYHLDNVLLHAGAVLLAWRLLVLLDVPGSPAAAALFAIHPVHVESVAWISERKNVLSGLLYLAAALVYLKGALSSAEGRPSRGRYVAAALLFVAAMLAKSVTCTWPVAIALALWWKRGRLGWRAISPLLPLLALGLGIAMVAVFMEQNLGARGATFALSAPERIVVAGRSLWFYAGKLLWPAPIVFIYERFEVDARDLGQYLFPLSAAAAVGLLFAGRRRLGAGPFVAAAYFVVTLSPALGFVSFYPQKYSFVADHFQYLASLGPLALGAAAIAHPLRTHVRRGAAIAALAALLLVGSMVPLTVAAQAKYRNAYTLWRDTVEQNPGAWIAHNNLGVIAAEHGRLDLAEAHFQAAARLAPGEPDVKANVRRLAELRRRSSSEGS